MKEQKPQSLKDIIIAAFSIREDTAPNSEIQDRLRSAGKVTGTNLCMMTCANLIACIGLNAGQMTVVVGAMLIEPLMGSILLIAYSTVSADKELFKTSALGFLFQIIASILASTVYFILTPVKGTTPELLSMAQPTLFEVLVAIIGGVAGIIGQTRTEKVPLILLHTVRKMDSKVISVDINSGMNGDTGEAALAVKSDLTVSIGYYKKGLLTGDADKYIGRLTNADIGIVLVDD